MKNLSVALDAFDVAGQHLADLHDGILKIAGDDWAAEILLCEYRETAIEYHEALKELQRYGIRSNEEAVRVIFREKEKGSVRHGQGQAGLASHY